MQVNSMRRRVGVVATAQTVLRPAWNEAQHIDLISSVVQRALKGSGLRIEDVDFVIDSGSDVLDGRSISNCGFLGAMGAHHKEESRVEDDGLWAASYGVAKIASGAAEVGLIIAYAKPSESEVSKFYSTMADPFYQRPVGLDNHSAAGLLAQRYLRETGLREEHLAELVVQAWSRAAHNAQVELPALPKLPTAADVMASPIVAAPIRQGMMSRPVDGAVAVLLASDAVARRVQTRPVWITGMGSAMDGNVFAMREPGSSACAAAARRAYAKAGVQPSAIGLAEISATSAVGELLALEALGLAEPGRGIDVVRGARGDTVNRSGGALPADPIMATGLVRLAEVSSQLWATDGATRALAHASSGIGAQSHCVFVLES